jgi:hypothetical protein
MRHRVVKFSQFNLSESDTSQEYNVPGIKPYMTDGYEISALDCTTEEDENGKIFIRKDSGTSVLLSFGDTECDIWIPKDAIEIKKLDDNYILTISPDSKWFNRPENRIIVEDFIEGFDSYRINTSSGDKRVIDGVSDDISTLLDMLGLDIKINSIEKISDNEYEITLDTGIFISYKKRSNSDMIGTTKFYLDTNSPTPGIEITPANDGINLISDIAGICKKEIETDFKKIKNDPYHRYLLKRPIGLESNMDRENLYSHYLEVINSDFKNDSKSEDPNISDSGRAGISYVKDIKKLIAEYISPEKIREISPDL